MQKISFKNRTWDVAGHLYFPENFDKTKKYAAIVGVHPGSSVKEQTTTNLLLKISGVILLSAGLILAIKPYILGKLSTSPDAYQMIEKRVRWGMLIGLGGFIIFLNNWTSWGLIVTALLASLTLGIIVARLTGLVLDGFFIKQLYWLLLEMVALIIFGFLYWKQTL